MGGPATPTGMAEARHTENRGRLYRMLWRWHFYAGLVCIPFVIVLALSGSVYLFRPQIEAWIDRDFLRLERTGQPATQSAIVDAAMAAIPGSKLAGIVLREHPDQAARVVVSEHGMRMRVYVHPDTLAVLKTVPEEGRFERTVAHIHGELLMGNAGSILVELAASWAIVMVLTGLYLWWPRQAQGLAGVLYPRIGQGAKRFWRDVHAVTGVWVSALALFLLATGLPWALVWGNGLKQVRAWTGTAAISQDWSLSSAGEHAEHMHHDAMAAPPAITDAPVDLIVARAEQLNLAPPVMLTPPARDAAIWWAKSNAQNRPQRRDVALSATTGDIVARSDFGGKHIIDQVIGVGLAAHEGQLFGPLNQALGVLTALGLITLCASAFVMWRRRSPEGVLGAPPPIPDARIGAGLAVMILVAAVLLPVLGASLVILAVIERGVLARWPAARRWLGLAHA
jgi:uncharacterized iron-regulated membrane protein